MKPLIAHVIDGLGSGGAEAMLVTNLRHFRDGRYEHVVITLFAENSPAYETGHFWADEVRQLGVRVIELRCSTALGLGLAAAKLAWVLRREKISLVHTHLLRAGLVGRAAARAARVPIVSSVHILSYEPEVLRAYRDPKGLKHGVARVIEAASLRQADAIVAVGQSVLDSAVKRLWVAPSRIRVVYNPVDFEAVDADVSTSRRELCKAANIDPSGELLINVGRVTTQKNQLGLVEAFAELSPRFPRAQLVILGALTSEAYTAQVTAAVERLGVAGRVHLLGQRKEVSAWLLAADLFVFPSVFEGLPVALLEAGAVGLCCVVSGILPNREIIEDGLSGLVVDSQTPSAFANAMARALGDAELRKKLGEGAKTSIRRRFSPGASIEGLSRVYDQVLQAHA